ncbi:MAG TPA: wax ester/triacylglycerol synthase domain-containing protein [Candidatus Binatia bacterium]|nr:wax ester/triacylglycerol synthase domain-containing protein [Candidatus Binatia bacterium]
MSELENGAGAEADASARYRALSDSELPLHVGALAVLDGPVDAEALERRVRERAAAIPRLGFASERAAAAWLAGARRRATGRRPGFVERVATTPPGGDAELSATVAELWSRPLASDGPRWEIAVVDGLARGRTAVLVKAHRSIANDGGGPQLAELLLGSAPPPGARAVARRRDKRPAGALPATVPARGVASALAAMSLPLFAGTRAVGRAFADVLDPATALARARDVARWLEATSLVVSTPAPETPFNGPLGGARRVGWVRLARDVLAGIEEAMEAPRSAVVLAILGDALGRYLKLRGRVTVALELPALVDPLEPSGEAAAGAIVSLPVGAVAARARVVTLSAALRDPAARARRASFDSVVSAALLLPTGGRSVGAALAYQAVNTISVEARATGGSGELAGRRCIFLVPIASLPWHVGLSFAWLDWGAEEVVVGIDADTALAPDVEAVEDCLRAAYVEAAASAGVPAIDPERRMRVAQSP